LENVGNHALERHPSCGHLRYALVGAVALADFEFVDAENRDEPHLWIVALFYFAEAKNRDTLKMLAADLAKQRNFIWVGSRH